MTTNTPHRWAEVIKAWADGKEIEYRFVWDDSKTWCTRHNSDCSPNFENPNLEWRIKPETKTGWIIIYNDNTLSNKVYETEERCRDMTMCANGGIAANIAAIIPITYTEGEGL